LKKGRADESGDRLFETAFVHPILRAFCPIARLDIPAAIIRERKHHAGGLNMDIMNQLEKFILADVAMDAEKKSILPDEDLLDQGLVDSLGIMKLVAFIKEAFGIDVADEDLIPENFETLGRITEFIAKKG
jgi:acyl carrier protein